MLVTLQMAKTHLRVINNAEDDLITLHINTAAEAIENYIDAEIPSTPPFAMQAACLLMVSDLYENREASSTDELFENPAVRRLLNPYREQMGV